MTVRLSKESGTDSLVVRIFDLSKFQKTFNIFVALKVQSLRVNVEFGPFGLGEAVYDCGSIFMNSLEVTKACIFKMAEEEVFK